MGKGSLELPGFYRSAPQLLLLLLYIHRDESSLFVGCRDSLGDWLSNQREREREKANSGGKVIIEYENAEEKKKRK